MTRPLSSTVRRLVRRPPRRLAGLAAALAVLFLVPFAGTVSAENTLISSNPAEGETVDIAPTQIQMFFQNPIGGEAGLAQVAVALSCEARLVSLGTLQLGADDRTVSAPLIQLPDTGTCTVSWSIGTDSSGTFSFENAAVIPTTTVPGGTVPTDSTVPTGETDEVTSTAPRLGGPVGLLRLLSFVFIAAMVGGLAMIALVWPEGPEYLLTERYMRLVGILATASMVGYVSLSTAQRTGQSVAASFAPTEWFELMSSQTGRGLFLRLFLVAALVYFTWYPERILDPATRPAGVIVLALLSFSFGFDRVGGDMEALGVLAGVGHMAFVLVWVGGALLVSRVILAGPGEEDLLQALRGWCRLATPVMLGIIGTGAVQTWRLNGASLLNSGHGRLVMTKILLVGALIVIERAMREYILRRLGREKELSMHAVFTLRRSATLQMGLSIVVLAASSWLMSMRPPNLLPEELGSRPEYVLRQELLGDDGFNVALSMSPGQIGRNTMVIELFAPERIQRFVISFIPPDPAFQGIEITVPLERRGAAVIPLDPGIDFRIPGQWTIEISGTTTTGDLETLRGVLTIGDGTSVATTVPDGTGTTTSTSSTTTTVG
jgi:copper transport protein